MEACQCVCQSKRHYLILKLAILSPKRCLLFVSLPDSHLIICTSKVELNKPFLNSPTTFQPVVIDTNP